ncbi:hypothetical protein, partial [Streptomyces sp. SID5910]|uniref:hypothetical protein n=1 Tax=Streptomyces sp. SID5910 TaxID=2690312 RepID=UPI0013708514
MSSAALPGAALRVMRTAAGWRALRLALLVGGLFLLGVVCGERAQAAEGVPAVPDAVGRVLGAVPVERALAAPAAETPSAAPESRPGRAAVPALLDAPLPVTPDDLRPVTDGVVRTVTDGVLRPVGGVVGTVTEELGEAVGVEVPPLEALPLPSSPSLPTVPSSPPTSTLPDTSGLPDGSDVSDGSGLPDLTDPTDPPVQQIPGDQEPGSVTAPDAEAGEAAHARASSDGPATSGPADVAYGPGLDGDGGTPAHDDARGVPAGPPAHAPAHR